MTVSRCHPVDSVFRWKPGIVWKLEKQADKDGYVVIKADIQTTKAAMLTLMDW